MVDSGRVVVYSSCCLLVLAKLLGGTKTDAALCLHALIHLQIVHSIKRQTNRFARKKYCINFCPPFSNPAGRLVERDTTSGIAIPAKGVLDNAESGSSNSRTLVIPVRVPEKDSHRVLKHEAKTNRT